MENDDNTEWIEPEPSTNVHDTLLTDQEIDQWTDELVGGRTPRWETPILPTHRQTLPRTYRTNNRRGNTARTGHDEDSSNDNHHPGPTVITPGDIEAAATIITPGTDVPPREHVSQATQERIVEEPEVDIVFDDYDGSLFEDSWYTTPETNNNTAAYGTRREQAMEEISRQGQQSRQQQDNALWHNVERCLQLRSPGWKNFQRDELHNDVDKLVHLVLRPDEMVTRRTNHIRYSTARTGTHGQTATTSFTSQELYTLYQLGEYLGLSPVHKAREQLASLTPQRWIQWTRFDAGSRIGPHQRNRSRDRTHQRGTTNIHDDKPGQNVRNTSYGQPPQRHGPRRVPYTPPHKRATSSPGGNAFTRNSDGGRERPHNRPQPLPRGIRNDVATGRRISEETPTSLRTNHGHNRYQNGTQNPNRTRIPHNQDGRTISCPPVQGTMHGPTIQQVRSSIQRVEQFLSLPDQLESVSSQMVFFIAHVVKDLQIESPYTPRGIYRVSTPTPMVRPFGSYQSTPKPNNHSRAMRRRTPHTT